MRKGVDGQQLPTTTLEQRAASSTQAGPIPVAKPFFHGPPASHRIRNVLDFGFHINATLLSDGGPSDWGSTTCAAESPAPTTSTSVTHGAAHSRQMRTVNTQSMRLAHSPRSFVAARPLRCGAAMHHRARRNTCAAAAAMPPQQQLPEVKRTPEEKAAIESQIKQLEHAAMEAHHEAQALNKQQRFEGACDAGPVICRFKPRLTFPSDQGGLPS
jgi:hypothetical protein